MSSQISNKIDINELIFTGKNKEYGAFKLRNAYDSYLSVALWIAIIFFVSVTAGPLIYNKLKPEPKELLAKKRVITSTQLAEPPSIDKAKPIEKIEVVAPPKNATIQYMAPTIKLDAEVTDAYIPTVDELKDIDPGVKTQQGNANGVDYSLMEVKETVEEKVVKEEESVVFTYVEEMPTFPGGEAELHIFIAKNVVYPDLARRANMEGRVSVTFIVEKTGEVTNVQVARGLGAGLDEEAVRVCKMMPRWKPGKQNGKGVKVQVTIPIKFTLK